MLPLDTSPAITEEVNVPHHQRSICRLPFNPRRAGHGARSVLVVALCSMSVANGHFLSEHLAAHDLGAGGLDEPTVSSRSEDRHERGNGDEARRYFLSAAALARSPVERRFLESRIRAIGSADAARTFQVRG